MASYSTEAIILKRTNYGEADRIITCYTKQYGKTRILAKGVRKISSRRAGNVEIFNQVGMYLAEGRNLDILTEASVVKSFPEIRKDLRKIAQAFYAVELVDRLTPDNQLNRPVYDLLISILTDINTDSANITHFEINLLQHLGFWSDALKNQNIRYYLEDILEGRLYTPRFQQIAA